MKFIFRTTNMDPYYKDASIPVVRTFSEYFLMIIPARSKHVANVLYNVRVP
jgi:hypothetical protein